ncbi:hypothetical protein [Dyella terrae]|uniref:hypothetical protein n=1 Tax=Dyella terrae TaxID=522259 RepID=UPI001EFC38E0|nr:hypothetical protein [Dyella terrae]ULU23909.1 hypothetical protein DYST_00808 [Dyella terrae]
MSPRSLPLLSRLRRHRGLWVLVVAVLLIKLVSGAVCLADGGERDTFRAQTYASVTMSAEAAPMTQGADADCLLGEGESCHCACAHAATLPVSIALAVGVPEASFAIPSIDAGRVPDATRSLLRPPIA